MNNSIVPSAVMFFIGLALGGCFGYQNGKVDQLGKSHQLQEDFHQAEVKRLKQKHRDELRKLRVKNY